MSGNENTQNQPKEKEERLRVVVDRSAEIEALQAELKKITAERETKTVEAEKLMKEKIDLESMKTNMQTEKEDLEAKLKSIAEKEFNAKKTAVFDRVKNTFKEPADEARLKEIEARLNDPEKGPENLKQTEYMMNILEDSFKKGKEAELTKAKEDKAKAAAETEKKAPTGGETAQLTQTQTGVTPPASTDGQPSYDSFEAMIRDLRNRARDPKDPVKQAEAEAILHEFWKKWAKQVKSDWTENTGKNTTNYEPEEQKSVRRVQKEGA